MSFPRYPKYKDSGAEWLGEVPEHWTLPPLYTRYEALLGKMLDEKRISGAHLLPYLRNTDVQWDRINVEDLPQMDIAPDERDRFTLRIGDLLVCEGGEIGRSAIWHGQLCSCAYQKAIHRLRPLTDQEHVRYLFYCMWSAAAKGVFEAGSNPNTIDHLTAEKLRRYRFPCPSFGEQTEIVAFLDSETTKIDSLVAEQQRLIELLQEKREAVISRIVKTGLNAGAPRKPSGTEWLGDVPAHWDVVRLGRLFHEVSDPGVLGLPILSVSIHSGVSDKELDESELDRKVTRSEDRTKYKRVRPGDLVYNMMRAWQGAFGAVATDGMVSPAYVVARPRQPVVTAYVEHLLRTPHAVEQMRRHSTGVTDFRLRLYWDEFKNIGVPIPPIEEAAAICDAMKAMDAEFNVLRAASEDTIALLWERRLSLISAAVTGKIDVRNYAAGEAQAS